MKVNINDHICTVGWQYESKVIERLKRKYPMDRSLQDLSKLQIAEALGLKAYPLPDKTVCIITDTVTGDVYTGTVKRFHLDSWDKEKARKAALTKAVWSLFPEQSNEEQSQQRKKFWDAYHNRKQINPWKTIDKAIKNGEFSLEDLRQYVNAHHTVSVH